jgi:cell division protein FtsZ
MAELLESVDTMIVIPNEKLLAVAKDAGFFESFRIADDVLRQGVQGISDIITIPGIINRDFADVKTTMAGMGHAVMGTAVRSGVNRAIEAAQAAMASPLLEEGAIDGARGILINITGSSSLKLSEVNEASSLIQTSAHEDANIIFGAVLDESMGEEVKITVIATGFRDQMPERRARMLDVEATPVVSVPVVAPNSWMKEADPSPLRFMSEVEEEESETLSWTPAPHSPVPDAELVPVAVQAVVEVETVSESLVEPVLEPFGGRFAHEVMVDAVPARPRFAELSEPPTYAPLPRDYATELHPYVSEASRVPTGATALFAQTAESEHSDLDVPAFLRRSQF